MHSLCAVIPVYDHEHAVGRVVDELLAHRLPCVLVDDGSSVSCAAVLDRLARQPGVALVRLPRNAGKGAAVQAGFAEARRLGHSHALQVDADGQHDLTQVPLFAEHACREPKALVCGHPRYDDSVPTGRRIGRYVTHVWVWINTCSFDIRDSMCGLRLYPLDAVEELLRHERIGSRMDFDTDILVRLHWRGVPMRWLPVAVHYPSDGLSHFRMGRDNLRISAMHARLFGGMLLRAPRWCWRRLKRLAVSS